jgi:hypothetical protein
MVMNVALRISVVDHLNLLMMIEIDMDKIEMIDDNNIVEDDMSMIDPRIPMNAELKTNLFDDFFFCFMEKLIYIVLTNNRHLFLFSRLIRLCKTYRNNESKIKTKLL